jgi:hypothetical protein
MASVDLDGADMSFDIRVATPEEMQRARDMLVHERGFKADRDNPNRFYTVFNVATVTSMAKVDDRTPSETSTSIIEYKANRG